MLADLPAVFREKATTLRMDGGADQPAVAWERAAELVEEALRGHSDEALTRAPLRSPHAFTTFDAVPMVIRRPLMPGPSFSLRPQILDTGSSR